MISCLTVTNRPEWRAWVNHQVAKQTTSADFEHIVIETGPGETIGAARTRALKAAKYETIAWFDDDDWSHPDRLAIAREYLGSFIDAVGNYSSFMIDAKSLRCLRYPGYGRMIFNGGVFRKSNYPESFSNVSQGEDLEWIIRARGTREVVIRDMVMSAWLCHEKNITNPARVHVFDLDLPRGIQITDKERALIPR